MSSLATKELSHPKVFRKLLLKRNADGSALPMARWSLDYLIDQLSCKKMHDFRFKFRVNRRQQPVLRDSTHKSVTETDSVVIKATLVQFRDWLNGTTTSSSSTRSSTQDSPFNAFPLADHWAYSDYNYIGQMFGGASPMHEILHEFCWEQLGELDIPAGLHEQTTLWLGSPGAFTALHQDTYAQVNVIAQLRGTKRWLMFPPSDAPCLYATRFPYEESSVFSQLNLIDAQPQQSQIKRQDSRTVELTRHPLFANSQPVQVELHAGDVMLLPRHWWHHVTCLASGGPGSDSNSNEQADYALSVNLWLEGDAHVENWDRMKEGLTQLLLFAMVDSPLLLHSAAAQLEDEAQRDQLLTDMFCRAGLRAFERTSFEELLDKLDELRDDIIKRNKTDKCQITQSFKHAVERNEAEQNETASLERVNPVERFCRPFPSHSSDADSKLNGSKSKRRKLDYDVNDKNNDEEEHEADKDNSEIPREDRFKQLMNAILDICN